MSQHRVIRPRRKRALLALIIAGGAAAALMAIGLVSVMVTGLVMLSQFVFDLTHGY